MSQRGVSSSWWRKVLQWPAFLAANLAILLLVGISTARETYQGWTVEREIHALEAQAASLEGRKMQLMEMTNALQDPDRVSLEARSRLGWKKDGERVIVLTGWQSTSTPSGDTLSLATVPSEPLPESNPRLWFRYFFHPLSHL